MSFLAVFHPFCHLLYYEIAAKAAQHCGTVTNMQLIGSGWDVVWVLAYLMHLDRKTLAHLGPAPVIGTERCNFLGLED